MVHSDTDRLWYSIPASDWNEALPLGNGRLGAMIFGGADDECYSMNEDTLWSGYPKQEHPGHPTRAIFDRAREMTAHGQFAQAQALMEEQMSGNWTQAYLPLCDVHFHSRLPSPCSGYMRQLVTVLKMEK